MVIGGWRPEYDVEIVDLSGENLTCFKPADYPIGYHSQGAYIGGKVLGC